MNKARCYSGVLLLLTAGASAAAPNPRLAKFWALKPVVRSNPPAGISPGTNPIDAFLRAKQVEKGLQATGPADKRTLLRRVYLDLIGLAPSPEEQEAFLKDTDPNARVKAYELAARMQLSAPALVDFANEPKSVLDLYGIGDKVTDDFGRQLLLARRMAEQGVRFIQICHAGGGNGAWDAHFDMAAHEPLCRATDKPIAGLITDLKQRGMLDGTLVVWTSEFGRTPWSQHDDKGRDHNALGYSSWFAGAGVKGGTVHGATDEVGYKAVEHRHYCSDLQATIVRQAGLDYKKMQFRSNGRNFHLIEEGDGPILDILS